MGGVQTQMSSLTGTGIHLLGLIYRKESKLIDDIQHTTNLALHRQPQECTSQTYLNYSSLTSH